MLTKKLEILFQDKPINVQYEHYRVDDSNNKACIRRKGKPKIDWLVRYYKSKHNWKPFSRGGKTVAILYTGDKKANDSNVLAVGVALCSMSDTFCYEAGRYLALTRALKSVQEHTSIQTITHEL